MTAEGTIRPLQQQAAEAGAELPLCAGELPRLIEEARHVILGEPAFTPEAIKDLIAKSHKRMSARSSVGFYPIVDPEDIDAMYAGRATNFAKRRSKHNNEIRSGRNTLLYNYARKHDGCSMVPVQPPQEMPEWRAIRAEQALIDWTRETGRSLNIIDAGVSPLSNPEVRAKHGKTMERVHRDPTWRKAQAEAGRRRAQDPAWRAAQSEAAKRIAQDPAWRRATLLAVRAARSRPVIDLATGVSFFSIRNTGVLLGVPPATVSHHCAKAVRKPRFAFAPKW